MNTTIEAVLYTSKTLSNGQHPIMLRLTKNRKRKYISLHISLAPQYWDAEKCKPRRNCPDKERIEALIQQKTQELQSQVMDFKTSDKEYTLNTLVEKASRKVVRQTVGDYLNGYIDRLLAANRIGNAKTFQELRTSLTRFCRSLDFYFIDIDAEWLKRYEQWLRVERHYSDNSIGIRFRSLRVLYNSAITDGLIKKTDYPFDTFKVSRFKEATAKRSLTKEDIRRIMDCEVRTLTKYPKPFLQLAKDLFLFSYLSCGINLTDILHIRYADIDGNNSIDENDKDIVGSTIPRYTYSLNLNFGWKGLRLGLLFQGVGKTDGYLNTYYVMPSNQGGTFRKEHLDWASAENPNGKTPRLTSANKNNWYDSSFWMKSAAYLRLKNIQLGYELPKSWMHRIGLNSAYLYVNAQNLFTVTNFWDGYDPEVGYGGDSSGDFDVVKLGSANNYPQVKIVTVGLELKF